MSTVRRLVQIIFSILAIIVLILTMSIYLPVPYLTRFTFETILTNETIRIGFAIILGLILIYSLVNFFQALFASSLKNKLELERDMGIISLEKDAIISTSRASIENMPQILESDIDARLFDSPEDTKIDAKIKVSKENNLIGLSEKVQRRIQDSIDHSLGVKVEKVNVRVEEIDQERLKDSKRKKDKSRPRVI